MVKYSFVPLKKPNALVPLVVEFQSELNRIQRSLAPLPKTDIFPLKEDPKTAFPRAIASLLLSPIISNEKLGDKVPIPIFEESFVTTTCLLTSDSI